MNFPIINTERLILNELQESDSEGLFELFSNQDVVKYYDLDVFTERSQALDLIHLFRSRFDDRQGIRWAIRLVESGTLIGTCGFNCWSPKMHSAVIGYDLKREFWGKGYAEESVNAMLSAGFNGDLACGKLNRVQADTVVGNNASEKLLNNLGFKFEGVRRQAGHWKGAYHDLKCFGLIKTDFV